MGHRDAARRALRRRPLLGRLGLKDLDMGNIGTPRRRIEVLPEAEPVHRPQQVPAPNPAP